MHRFLCLTLFLALAAAAPAQLSQKANAGYQTEEDRARVARSLANPEREEEQKPRELLDSIGVEKGMVIADIGTGVGFMLPYFQEAIGPEGKIYAEDIQQQFLDDVEKMVDAHQWENVVTILGDQVDPKLPAGAIDLAFILDAYHHFEYPVETMKKIRAALKPDGRLVVVDFYKSRTRPGRDPDWLKNHIRLDREGFQAEIEQAGFEMQRTFDHLPYQYAMIFEKSE